MKATILFMLISMSALMNAQTITNGLIAYYKCDGNADDISTGHNDGKLNGGVRETTDRWGNSCSALEFNGLDGYISIPDSRSLNNISNQLTISAWFRIHRTNDNVRWLTLMCKGDKQMETMDNPQYRLQFQTSAKSTISINTVTAKTPFSGSDLPDDEWSFIAMVYDGSDMNLYLNDSLIFTWPVSQNFIANNSALDIGRDVPGHAEFFKGCLDDIRIYNRALTFQELKTLYNDQTSNTHKFDFALESKENIISSTDKGKCGAVINFPPPVLKQDCDKAILLQVAGAQSGSFFDIGYTTIAYVATGIKGRKEVNSFEIQVVDGEKPELTCPVDIVLNANSGEMGMIVSYQEPQAIDNCKDASSKLLKGLASGSKFPIGITNVTYEAMDKAGNTNECSFNVTVTSTPDPIKPPIIPNPIPRNIDTSKVVSTPDSSSPEFICTSDMTLPCEFNMNGAKVFYVKPSALYKGVAIPIKLIAGLESGDVFPIGITRVSYMAESTSGNIAKCSFNVNVTCKDEWNISCPSNIIMNTDKGKCGAMATFSIPQVNGTMPVEIKQTNGQKTGSVFNVGITKNSFSGTDKTGQSLECSFTITVIDNEKPNIACPHDTTIWIESSETGINYKYTEPVITDNCGKSQLKLVDGPSSGDLFPIGINVVTFSAIDQYNNKATCSFTVKVRRKDLAPNTTSQKTVYGDSIRIRHADVINYCTVTLFVADDGVEDGDTVSIFFNDEEIVKKQRLKINKGDSYQNIIGLLLTLDPNKTNTIIAKAWNVGTIPPNTMEIRIFSGNVLNDLPNVKTKKPILKRKFECYPGLTDGMSLNCNQ